MCEILSPAGGPESLRAALTSGCDAVYVGGEFSARRNAENFTRDELKRAVYECHSRGVKLYQAINTVYFDDEKKRVEDELGYAAEIGVDALIIQDLGVLETVKRCCPEMPLHASTQMTIHTPLGALWAKRAGFKRVVLSRECSATDIKKISSVGIETEVFVHGALCMSVSGQCYLSAMIGGRSANRGFCAGACRLPFSAKGKLNGDYALSLKDLCAYDALGALSAAGVTSFKIEGRMKRPEYVAAATSQCAAALKTGSWDKKLLESVFSRDGFTNGYIEKPDSKMFGFRTKEDYLSEKNALGAVHDKMRAECKRYKARFSVEIRRGERIRLTACSDDEITAEVLGEIPETAKKRETSESEVVERIEKLGGTQYESGGVKVSLDGGLFVSAAGLNKLRREAIDALDRKRYEKQTSRRSFQRVGGSKSYRTHGENPTLRISAEKAEQIKDIWRRAELLSLPFEQIKRAGEIPAEKLCMTLPRLTPGDAEVSLIEKIDEAYAFGIRDFLLQNLSHIELLRKLREKDAEVRLHGFFGLNVTNSEAIEALENVGLSDVTLSFELSAGRIQRIKSTLPIGAIVYGRLPLMLTRLCPIKAAAGCGGCRGELVDRRDERFRVFCRKKDGYFELLNSKPLYLADRPISGVDYGWFMFTDESADECARVLGDYENSRPRDPEFTRGLYYRRLY